GCPGLKQSQRHVLAQKKNERRDRAQQLREIFRRKTLDAEQRAGTGGLIALHPSERAGLAENVAPAKNYRTSGQGRFRGDLDQAAIDDKQFMDFVVGGVLQIALSVVVY